MEKYDNFINYIENNKIIDEKFIINYLEKDNINFLSNIKEDAYYDIDSNQIYVSMENILSHFDEPQNKRELINTNLNILEAIVHETIHEDQMKNIDLEIKQYQMLKDVIKFKGNDRLTAKELYNLMYKCLPQEYNANISAFYEMVELCNYMNTQDPSLGFKKMPLKLKALIMLRGHIYNFEDNHNLSPVEKFYNITGQRERKEEILTNVNLSEYDKIMFGFPVPETTKQKVLKIKEGDDITNIFTK